jgi:TPR repeat protein
MKRQHAEMVLVFDSKQCNIATMDKSSHHEMFSHPQSPASETVPPVAGHGDAEAQFNLGLKFASGKGAAQDFVQAAECYRKAAEQSHSLAQFNLGVMCAEGQGFAPDAAQSLVWFGKAAQQGDAGAQYRLGDSCHRASFEQVPADAAESRIEAYKWYRLAAAQGYKNSETAYATLSIKMSWADVAAGNERVAAFEKS